MMRRCRDDFGRVDKIKHAQPELPKSKSGYEAYFNFKKTPTVGSFANGNTLAKVIKQPGDQ